MSARFTPWSRRYLDWRVRFPFDGDAPERVLRVDKTVDGGWLVSGRHIQGLLKLSEEGEVRWARALRLPDPGDEGVSKVEAESAVVRQAPNTDIWVATSRFTVMQLDQDGDLVWARRFRPDDASLSTALEPVGLVPTPDAGAFVLYAPTLAGRTGLAVLLRIDRAGRLEWAKTLAYETDITQARVLVGDGDEVIVAGHSWDPAFNVARVTRFRADGTTVFARALDVGCGETPAEPRVTIASGIRLASGALAFVGSHQIAPERPFLLQLAPDGSAASIATWSVNVSLFDLAASDLAQLPVTGFLTVGSGSDSVNAHSVLIASHDATGEVSWQRNLRMQDDAGVWFARTGAVRLTTDGGALVFAYVADPVFDRQGLWVSKIPARTGEAAFDPASVTWSDFPAAPAACSVALRDDEPTIADLAVREVDSSKFVVVERVTPTVEAVIPE